MDPPLDRRPIPARDLKATGLATDWLVGVGATANGISAFGMVLATLAGASILGTAYASPTVDRLLWLAAALLVVGRLLCNMLDGTVAVARGTTSKFGELMNEAPDRFSDVVILAALGYGDGGSPELAWAAATFALATAYVRALGKSMGFPGDYRGPMAKQHRMWVVIALGLVGLILPRLVMEQHLAAWAAGLVAVGSIVTSLRRLAGIVGKLRA